MDSGGLCNFFGGCKMFSTILQKRMHDANIDEIKVKLDPYPKLDDNSGENKNKYMGQEYIIVRLCHKQLYKTFPWMRGAFSEFAV